MDNWKKWQCDVCHKKVKFRDRKEENELKILPDCRRVCKLCWGNITEDTLMKNANMIMHA